MNNGLLDLITGEGPEPAGLINSGDVYTAENAPQISISVTGDGVTLQFLGLARHTYEVSSSSHLSPASWTPIEAARPGLDAVMTFN